ncbi:hypothetical protein NIT7321_01847 [Phaeobacter italicus]|uniref:Uncharacterized protein n=1 Tax=Phaeobacter italicus TaxID=481446 RepID=A0A0H5D2P0_9RHOB|nr:hypothetical protein NIT7321_01847 [Phaeobacter italicus]
MRLIHRHGHLSQLAGGLGVQPLDQMGEEPFSQRQIASLQRQQPRLRHGGVEEGRRTPVRHCGRVCQIRVERAAQGLGCEQAVKGGLVLRCTGIGGIRLVRIAKCRMGATQPIAAPPDGDRGGDGGQKPVKVIDRQFGVTQLAQGDIACDPFAVGIAIAHIRRGKMMCGQLIGAFVFVVAQQLAREIPATAEPFFRLAQFLGRGAAIHQQFDRIILPPLAVAPGEPVMGQPRIIAQRLRDGGDPTVHARFVLLQRQPRLSQFALCVTDQRQDARCAGVVPVPQHPVQPRRVMWGEEVAVAFQKIGLRVRAHRQAAPGDDQLCAGVSVAICRLEGACIAERPERGLRAVALVKGENRAGACGGDHLFAAAPQERQAGPVGTTRQKGHDIRSRPFAGAQAVPFDHIPGDGGFLACAAACFAPFFLAHQLQCAAQIHRFGIGAAQSGGNEDNKGQNACHLLHFPTFRAYSHLR